MADGGTKLRTIAEELISRAEADDLAAILLTAW
jgi:hypothetical protein